MPKASSMTKLHVGLALSERDSRVACLICESVRNALDLLDEQPAVRNTNSGAWQGRERYRRVPSELTAERVPGSLSGTV
jgi:hypothetical protein